MKNLQFLSRLDNLVNLGISMVVQQDNYRQMLSFIELAESLVYRNRPTFVEFKRLRHDSHISAEDYKKMGLDDIDPAMKEDFLNMLVKVETKRKYNAKNKILPSINHNLHEYLTHAKIEIPEPPSKLSKLASLITSFTPPSFRR